MLRSMATSLSISWSSPNGDAPAAWAWLANCHPESCICIMGALAGLVSWENVIESEPGDVPILGNLLGAFDHDTWRRTEIILQFCCS